MSELSKQDEIVETLKHFGEKNGARVKVDRHSSGLVLIRLRWIVKGIEPWDQVITVLPNGKRL